MVEHPRTSFGPTKETKKMTTTIKKRVRSGPRVSIDCGESKTNPMMTKQSFKDECDINRILAVAEQTGLVGHVNNAEGQYLNVSSVPDYQTSINLVRNADQAFANLPAGIRRRFQNDPVEFLAFMGDEENLDEAIEMGLLPQAVDPPTVKTAEKKAEPKEEPKLPLET